MSETTFTCINPNMTLLLNDNKSKVKFDNGVFVAKGEKQIAAVREAIESCGYKSRFGVVDRSSADSIIAKHQAAKKAAAIQGAVGSQSDDVQGRGRRAIAEKNMEDAGVEIDTPAAQAVLDAIAPNPNQPVGDTDLKTEAADILSMSMTDRPADPVVSPQLDPAGSLAQPDPSAVVKKSFFAPKV